MNTSPAPELMPQALQFEKLVRGKRILVVDDEKYILDFFVEIFPDPAAASRHCQQRARRHAEDAGRRI